MGFSDWAPIGVGLSGLPFDDAIPAALCQFLQPSTPPLPPMYTQFDPRSPNPPKNRQRVANYQVPTTTYQVPLFVKDHPSRHLGSGLPENTSGSRCIISLFVRFCQGKSTAGLCSLCFPEKHISGSAFSINAPGQEWLGIAAYTLRPRQADSSRYL